MTATSSEDELSGGGVKGMRQPRFASLVGNEDDSVNVKEGVEGSGNGASGAAFEKWTRAVGLGKEVVTGLFFQVEAKGVDRPSKERGHTSGTRGDEGEGGERYTNGVGWDQIRDERIHLGPKLSSTDGRYHVESRHL